MPKQMLYSIIENGNEIFMCSERDIKELRTKLNLKKTDETDVVIIKTLYEKPQLFKKLMMLEENDIKIIELI